MTRGLGWACKALVFMLVLAAQPALAQIQPTGWPAAAAAVKPAAAAVAATRPDAVVAAKAPRRRAATTEAMPAPAATVTTTAEVTAMLQRQVALLEQLVAELESQRAVMREQLHMIRALEEKTPSGVPPASLAMQPMRLAVPVAVTRAPALNAVGQARRWTTWFGQTGRSERPAAPYTGGLFAVKFELVSGRARPAERAGAYAHPQ